MLSESLSGDDQPTGNSPDENSLQSLDTPSIGNAYSKLPEITTATPTNQPVEHVQAVDSVHNDKAPVQAKVLDAHGLTSNTTYKWTSIPGVAFDSYWIFGPSLIGIGDVTGDGISDLGFSYIAPWSDAKSIIIPGRSGGFQTVVDESHSILPPDALIANFGFTNSVGDINADGQSDLVILREQYIQGDQRTYVVLNVPELAKDATPRLPDGKTVFQLEHPGRVIQSVTGLGDTNGDGIDDFILSTGTAKITAGANVTVFLPNWLFNTPPSTAFEQISINTIPSLLAGIFRM